MKKLLLLACALFISILSVSAQDNLKIDVKKDAKPDLYIDGKKYDNTILDLLDQDKIESVNVIKDEEAMEKYNAPNGVIVIVTKKSKGASFGMDIKDGKDVMAKIEKTTGLESDKDPKVYIDGKLASRADLKKLNPKNIESINVFKGAKAIEKYDAPNGAIVVKTKE